MLGGVALVLAAGTVCCSLLGPRNTIETKWLGELVGMVLDRTDDYVSLDPELGEADKVRRWTAVQQVRIDIDAETITRAEFRDSTEEVFGWHDDYVRADQELDEVRRARQLRTTEIFREKYYP